MRSAALSVALVAVFLGVTSLLISRYGVSNFKSFLTGRRSTPASNGAAAAREAKGPGDSRPSPKSARPPAPGEPTGEADRSAAESTPEPMPPANGATAPLSGLRPGLDRARVQREFGKPTLVITSVEKGTLKETYVYQRERGGQTTFAYLQDGVVTRVASSR